MNNQSAGKVYLTGAGPGDASYHAISDVAWKQLATFKETLVFYMSGNNLSSTNLKESAVEKIKKESHGLRGNLGKMLQMEHTGGVEEQDETLIKFHGMYQQDDRDKREERAAKKLERLYSFMIRLRLPGGLLNPLQWQALHNIAGGYSTGIIKITTRQTVQLHGIVKANIKPTIKAFNTVQLDSMAGCGDVNRNVVVSAHPDYSLLHEEIFAYADKISTLLLP